jgi:hypothetical protein
MRALGVQEYICKGEIDYEVSIRFRCKFEQKPSGLSYCPGAPRLRPGPAADLKSRRVSTFPEIHAQWELVATACLAVEFASFNYLGPVRLISGFAWGQFSIPKTLENQFIQCCAAITEYLS